MKRALLFFLIIIGFSACGQSNEIYLLVRADDMGSTHASNQACMEVFTNGIARSVEVMPVGPWFPECVKMLKEHPEYDAGIHLAMTSEWSNLKWGPLTNAPSLVTEDGYFYRTYWKSDEKPQEITFRDSDWTIEDVEKELRAQIEYATKHLPWITHINIHMGGASADPKIREVFERLGQEYGLLTDLDDHDFQRFSGFGQGGNKLTLEEKIERLVENLETLKPGKYLFVDHPAYDTPEMQAIHHKGYENVARDRDGVTKAWTDERVKEVIERRGIKLISYKDVMEGKVQ